MKKTLAIALIISVLGVGCKKEDVGNVELLAGVSTKRWVIKAATIDPAYPAGGTTITNYFAQLPKCQQDDEFLFGSDNSYADIDAGVRCGGPEINAKGVWFFNDKVFTIGAKTYTLVELTASNLAFTQTFVERNVTFTVTWRYSAK